MTYMYCPIDIAISELPLRNTNAWKQCSQHTHDSSKSCVNTFDTARIRMITQNQRFDKKSPFQVDDQVLILS